MKIETAPNRLLTATGADRDPLLGSGYIPSLNTPDDPLFPELDIDSTFLNAGNDDLIGDDDIDYDAAARQLLEQSGFVDVPAANTAPATPQSQPSTAIAIALDIPAVLEANRRTKSTAGAAATTSAFALPAPITLARGASVIPPGPPSLSSRPMVGEQRAHGERHKGLVMPRVVPSRTSLSGPSSASAQQGGQQQQQKTPDSASPISSNNNNNNNDPLPSLSIDRINEESRALLAHLLSGLTAPLMMQGSSSNSNNAVAATETSDQFGIDPRGLGGLPANTFPTPPEDHAMEERDLEEEEEEQEEDSEVDQVRMRVKREPDPDFAVPAPRTRSRSRTSINATKAAGSTSTARSSRRTSTTTTKPTSKPTRSRSTPSKPQYAATSDYDSDEFDNNSDDLDAPLHEITSLIASSHAHRGAPPHKSNQPIGETDDLQRRLDEDDRVIEAGGKGLSSKERRQLRNKISARNFRARRKEVSKKRGVFDRFEHRVGFLKRGLCFPFFSSTVHRNPRTTTPPALLRPRSPGRRTPAPQAPIFRGLDQRNDPLRFMRRGCIETCRVDGADVERRRGTGRIAA